jgi:uncharacterized membrane protein YccF (DUF307 family)
MQRKTIFLALFFLLFCGIATGMGIVGIGLVLTLSERYAPWTTACFFAAGALLALCIDDLNRIIKGGL